MIDAAVLAGVAHDVERQVNRLAHFALLEQGGITFARHLNDLVLGGVQHDLVFARFGVRTDGHRVAGDIYPCRVPFGSTEDILVGGALHRLVILLADEVRDVVALQLHHNLDRVAQIVLRQALAQGLAALYVATHHATAQHDGGRVPEVHASYILIEIVVKALLRICGIMVL